MDLHVLVGDVESRFRAVHLDDAALHRVFLGGVEQGVLVGFSFGFERIDALLHQVRDAVGAGFECEQPDRHFGQLVLDGSEIADRLLELVAFVGVFDRNVRRGFGAAERHHAEFVTTDIQDVERDEVPLADGSEQVLLRNTHILEKHLTGARPLDTEFVLFRSERNARALALHDEAGEFIAIQLRENDENVRESAVADPHFLTVQDVLVAVFVGAGFGGEGIGAAAGFGQAVGGLELSATQVGQVLSFLRFGSEVEDGQRTDTGVRRHGCGKAAGNRAQFFVNDRIGVVVHEHPTVFFGDMRTEQPEFTRFLEQLHLVLDFAGAIVRGSGEILHHLANHFLLFVEIFGDEHAISGLIFDQKFSAP